MWWHTPLIPADAEAGRPLSLRPAWSTKWVQGSQGYTKTPYLKKLHTQKNQFKLLSPDPISSRIPSKRSIKNCNQVTIIQIDGFWSKLCSDYPSDGSGSTYRSKDGACVRRLMAAQTLQLISRFRVSLNRISLHLYHVPALLEWADTGIALLSQTGFKYDIGHFGTGPSSLYWGSPRYLYHTCNLRKGF